MIVLVLIFFLSSVVGVVTGSNSLITVPAMFQIGVDPRVAVATNMFGLVFMSIGGTIPFVRQRKIDYSKLSPFIILTLISSAIGALLVGLISGPGIKLIVSIAMIAVALFTLLKRDAGVGLEHKPVEHAVLITYVLVFLLGIYGGLFSGGYTTILTAVLRRHLRYAVHRGDRLDQADKCVFIGDCNRDFYVARFSGLQTWPDPGSDNVCRGIRRGPLCDKGK